MFNIDMYDSIQNKVLSFAAEIRALKDHNLWANLWVNQEANAATYNTLLLPLYSYLKKYSWWAMILFGMMNILEEFIKYEKNWPLGFYFCRLLKINFRTVFSCAGTHLTCDLAIEADRG